MYISRIALDNIRTFEHSVLEFIHPDRKFRAADAQDTTPAKVKKRLPRPKIRNVTLLIGDNGSGKSSVLRAIAAATFGPAAKDLLRDSSVVRIGTDTGRIFADLVLHPQDAARRTKLECDLELRRRGERLDVTTGQPDQEYLWEPVYESKNDAFFVVGYGATRRVERLDTYDPGARLRARTERDLRVQSLFEEAFSLIPLASWLPRFKLTNPGRYTQLAHLLDRLLRPGQFRFTGEVGAKGEYLFARGNMKIPFQALSDGYRAFIGWVADLLYHVCMTTPKGQKLVENRGIALVDEIDLHLHPRWQMQVIRTVSRALPRMQFVFTSHSPLVVGSLEWMNIITLKAGPKNRTAARRLRESVHGLDADQILLTDFFGLKTTRAPGKVTELEALRLRARHGDKEAARQLILALSRGTEEVG
jgi:predicted ATPase